MSENNLPEPKGLLHIPAYTDNRDMTTTELVLEDGTRVEVNPVELYQNALENNSSEPTYTLTVTVTQRQMELMNYALEHLHDVDFDFCYEDNGWDEKDKETVLSLSDFWNPKLLNTDLGLTETVVNDLTT